MDNKEILELANLPRRDGSFESLGIYGEVYAQRKIYEFYKDTPLEPKMYSIKQDGMEIVRTPTLIYESDLPEKFNLLDEKYSDFSDEWLKRVGIDLENTWNGDSASYLIRDDRIDVIESDYYTTELTNRCLYLEAVNSVGSFSDAPLSETYPLRTQTLSTMEDLLHPSHARNASGGGMIFARHNNSWYLILGERSTDIKINRGLISIIPNGSVEYSELKTASNYTFQDTARREFVEEAKLDPSVELLQGMSEGDFYVQGYVLTDGHLTIARPIFIDVPNDKEILDVIDVNDEFTEVYALDVTDAEEIAEHVSFGNTSPETIGKIYETLRHFSDKFDIPYTIEIERGK